ncbi:hypothetical protein MKW92_026622 [Papaver armeniacum]|nr:hypothetical protein MKW92_026622 [Papaver armeniacum]
MMLSFGGSFVLKDFVVSINAQFSLFGIRKAKVQYEIFRNFSKFPTSTVKSQLEAPRRIDHQLPQTKRTMEDVSTDSMSAVVTGVNKGIEHEIVRRLALEGVSVVLKARDEKIGSDAVSLLAKSGLKNVVFHHLDAKYVQTQFGKLDILVNNAGALGVVVDEEGLRALNIDPVSWVSYQHGTRIDASTYEKAVECLATNYYGCKRLSKSGARIVSVSSLRSELKRIPNEQIRKEPGDLKNLTEEEVDKMVQNFLHDLKHGMLEENEWMRPDVHTRTMNIEDGAKGLVMLALLSDENL